MLISGNVEPDQSDFAFAPVTLNYEFLEVFASNLGADYYVNVFSFVFRRYDYSTAGAWEISFSLKFSQVHLIYQRWFHLFHLPF